MKNGYCFDDVLLVPQFSDITSRSEINLTSYLDNRHRFRLPIISSPMDTVTGAEMARSMSDLGGLGIIHRYNTITDQIEMVNHALSNEYPEGNEVVGVAVGVSGDYLQRAWSHSPRN